MQTMTFEPIHEYLEGPEIVRSEMWRIEWLWSGWHLVLRQKLLICDTGVTKHIAVFVCLLLSLKMLLFTPYEMPSVFAYRTNVTHPTGITIMQTLARIFYNVS